MKDIILLSAGILATYRLAQLIAQDAISEPLRARISKNGAPPESLSLLRRWLAYGLMCVVCVSVWCGLTIAFVFYGLSAQAIVYGLAYSGGAVILGSWLAAQNRSKP